MNGRPRIDHICATTKLVIRLSTGHRVEASSRSRVGKGGSPWRHGTLSGSSPFAHPLPLVIAPHFFRAQQNTSQSRNSKLLNYFPIAVATDHVCSSPRLAAGPAPDITSAVFFSDRGVRGNPDRKIHCLSSGQSCCLREISRRELCTTGNFADLLFIYPFSLRIKEECIRATRIF